MSLNGHIHIYSPLHYRQLQSLNNNAFQSGGNYNTKVSLNPACQEELQWWIEHLNASPTRSSDRNRCITTGLGGCMQRTKDRGPLVSEGTTSAHQLSGTICRGFCSEMFHKEPDLFAYSPKNGQYNCHCILTQTGRDSLLSSVQSSCRALELGTQQGHDSLCRAFAREVEYPSRSGVETLSGLQRLAFRSISIPCFDENSGTLPNRSICQLAECLLPAFFSWKPDPQGLASDAFQQARNTGRNYAFPPFWLIMKTLAKLREESGNSY